MNKLFTAGPRCLCSSGWGMAAAGITLPLAGFLVLCLLPAALPLAAAAAAVLLAVLLAGAMQAARRSEARAQAAEAKAQAARAALETQQQEMEASTQSMDAANALMAQASGRFQELFQGLPAACVCFDKSMDTDYGMEPSIRPDAVRSAGS